MITISCITTSSTLPLPTPVKESPLGHNLIISSVGLADDNALGANSITNLSNILYLALKYCEKYNVTLCADKTKLLMFGTPQQQLLSVYNPIEIDAQKIELSSSADHVGILRSVDGNLPHIVARISSHERAIGANLSSGLARSHRANPAASLKIESMYATPVLLSGVASLVLTKVETNMLNQHYKNVLQNLQKLATQTPHSVTHFLAGSLPLTAQLHLRQLGLFGMICRLPDDPLNIHARNVLTMSKRSCKSGFWQVRDLFLQYNLPHPLQFLDHPPDKEKFRKLVRSRVVDYWEQKLRMEASILPSLAYFHTQFMSLAKPHPLWLTAGSNPHEVSKASSKLSFFREDTGPRVSAATGQQIRKVFVFHQHVVKKVSPLNIFLFIAKHIPQSEISSQDCGSALPIQSSSILQTRLFAALPPTKLSSS